MALGVAVFLSGAVLLGVEIAASRVLAPAFGSSLYVWGSLIGVVLTGLAIGYWAGGALADRYPSPLLLITTLSLGAGLVLLVPVLDGWVIERIVAWDPGPRLDPLLAAIVLFAPVSIVLAAATPIAVRLAAHSLERLGRTAGRLFSVSTAGSIFGTFATAFWLVPELGTDQVLAIGAVTLLGAAATLATARSAARSGCGAPRCRDRSRVRGHEPLAAGIGSSVGVRGAELVAALPGAGGANAQGVRPRRRRRPRVELPGARGARHPLPPPVRARRGGHAVPPLRQHLSERNAARRPLRHRLPVHRLPPARPRLRTDCQACALHRPRRRNSREA